MINELKYWGFTFFCLGIMLCFKFIPPIGALTPIGMQIIGIFIGMIIAYCTVGMVWPSITALVLLGLTVDNGVTGTFKEAFGHPVVLYMFALLMIGKILEESGMTQIFAQWLITLPVAHNRPWVLSTLILLAGFVCALFIGMIAPALICWTIVCEISEKVGYNRGDSWPTYMILSIMFLCTVASFVFPFQLGVVANFGILAQVSGGVLVNQFVPYLCFSTLLVILVFISCILLGKYVIRPDMQLLMNVSSEKGYLRFDRKQKVILILTICFVIGLFLPGILPPGALKNIIDNIGSTGWSALIIALCVALRNDHKPLIDFNKIAAEGVIWDIILMMAAIFSMSAALTTEDTGFSIFIQELLTPLLNNCSPIVYMGIMIVLTAILANLINNIAVCAILIPIAYTLAGNLNIDILALVTLMNVVGNLGFLLPSSSSQAAMIYGHGWLDKKSGHKMALMEMGIALILTIAMIPIAIYII